MVLEWTPEEAGSTFSAAASIYISRTKVTVMSHCVLCHSHYSTCDVCAGVHVLREALVDIAIGYVVIT